jgi:thioredoxin-related protein
MKKIFLSISAITLLGLLSFKPVSGPLSIGSELPNAAAKMKDISGKEVSFKDAMKANGLLVMFSCNTCPFVIKHEDKTKEVSEFALKNNIGVILVNSNEAKRDDDDSFKDMVAYAKDQGYKWYYTVDEKSAMADAFGATMTPESFLFNKDGKLVYHGAINDKPRDPNNATTQYLVTAITEMVAGKSITTSRYPQFGCSIKRKG